VIRDDRANKEKIGGFLLVGVLVDAGRVRMLPRLLRAWRAAGGSCNNGILCPICYI